MVNEKIAKLKLEICENSNNKQKTMSQLNRLLNVQKREIIKQIEKNIWEL
jgi:hypothetical protein